MDVFDNLDLSSSLSSDSGDLQIIDYNEPANNQKIKDEYESNTTGNYIQNLGADKGLKEPYNFFQVNRPPSRHKTPPKAIGLELPAAPHSPPKTQEDCDEYSHTVNLKGISFFISDAGIKEKSIVDKHDSDYDSFSSSKYQIQ